MGEHLRAQYLAEVVTGGMSAKELRDALALGETNLPRMTEAAQAELLGRMGAMRERLRRIEATEARIRYEKHVLTNPPEEGVFTVYPIRYIVTALVSPRVRVMVGPGEASNTWGTEKDAEGWLACIRKDPEARALYGPTDTFEVRPVPCYPGTLDPTQTVFREELAVNTMHSGDHTRKGRNFNA